MIVIYSFYFYLFVYFLYTSIGLVLILGFGWAIVFLEPTLNAFSVHIFIKYPLFSRYIQYQRFYELFLLIIFCFFYVLGLVLVNLLVMYYCGKELESVTPITVEKISETVVEKERREKSKVRYVIIRLLSLVIVAGLIFVGYSLFYREGSFPDYGRKDNDGGSMLLDTDVVIKLIIKKEIDKDLAEGKISHEFYDKVMVDLESGIKEKIAKTF